MTTHTVPAADGADGWHRTPVNVTLSAADDGECVSGVDKTEFRVGSGAFATYTAPVAITGDGTHVVEYRSTDKAGNAETAKSTTVKLDATAPTTTASVAQSGVGPATLTLSATDPASGVARTEYRVGGGAWTTYDAASKPVFTAAGTQVVDYRSTDVAGNAEAPKTVTVTVGTSTADVTAPVTQATLDPAQPGAGGAYSGPVTVGFSALDADPASNVDVYANGTVWAPAAVSVKAGDTVTWRFDKDAGFSHDLKLQSPAGQLETLSMLSAPNSPPITKRLDQVGTWTFICTFHPNMTGTAVVSPGTSSGVDYTESRVDGGAWGKGTSLTVSAPGSHTVEFRSADKAGNVETAKSVGFSIQPPVTPLPTVQPTATPAPPAATPTPGPSLVPSFKLATPAKTTVAKFAKRGMAVRATCTQAMSGQATLTVTSKVRKALKLKSATLAKGTVACKAGAVTVTLKPSASTKRVLAKAKQAVKAKLTMTLKPAGAKALTATVNVTLARK